MPHYFFNVVRGEQTAEDLEGIELPGNAAALEEAALFAHGLRDNRTAEGSDQQTWAVEVRDETGVLIERIAVLDSGAATD